MLIFSLTPARIFLVIHTSVSSSAGYHGDTQSERWEALLCLESSQEVLRHASCLVLVLAAFRFVKMSSDKYDFQPVDPSGTPVMKR